MVLKRLRARICLRDEPVYRRNMAEGPVTILSEHPGGDSGQTGEMVRVLRYETKQRHSGSHAGRTDIGQTGLKPMSNTSTSSDEHGILATPDNLKHVMGDLDEAKLLDIMALRPTIIEVEEALVWHAGDTDIFGAGQPLKGVAGDIVAILTADEEEEPPRTQ